MAVGEDPYQNCRHREAPDLFQALQNARRKKGDHPDRIDFSGPKISEGAPGKIGQRRRFGRCGLTRRTRALPPAISHPGNLPPPGDAWLWTSARENSSLRLCAFARKIIRANAISSWPGRQRQNVPLPGGNPVRAQSVARGGASDSARAQTGDFPVGTTASGGRFAARYTRLQILSFERLADFILTKLHRAPSRMLSEEGRVMVLRALLSQNRDQLEIFRGSARMPGFAQQLSLLLRNCSGINFPPPPSRRCPKKSGTNRNFAPSCTTWRFCWEPIASGSPTRNCTTRTACSISPRRRCGPEKRLLPKPSVSPGSGWTDSPK